ncbi:MAG: hypothetical protein ACOYKC_09235 [Anaerolineaceae bacterium]|jgi:hypothetical protein
MKIWERVEAALAGIGMEIPVANNRLILNTGEDWPDRYIVYQVISSSSERHVDDREIERSHLVQVNMWSKNGFLNFPDVEGAMLSAGFSYDAGRDMEYDNETGHYGRSEDYLFIEEKE